MLIVIRLSYRYAASGRRGLGLSGAGFHAKGSRGDGGGLRRNNRSRRQRTPVSGSLGMLNLAI
jgi:hypothetical protein